MNTRDANKVEKMLRADGHAAERIGIENERGKVVAIILDASDINRRFESLKEYQEWKSAMESDMYV